MSSAQHQAVAQHYRNIIEQALREFDDSHPDELYEALAWIGLNSADIVAWQNLSPAQQQTINATIYNIQNTFENGCD